MNYRLLYFIQIIIIVCCISSCSNPQKPKKVLIFSKTLGYRHASIPTAREVLTKLLLEKGIQVDTTEHSTYFHTDSLKNYSAVVFLMTSGNVLDYRQQAHFERYIQAGGGYVGIHSATDTEYKWPWYGKLSGAYFSSHPKQQNATIDVLDTTHVSTDHLPATWKRFDEWYNFKEFNPDVNVLMNLDESSYNGGTHGEEHPIAWYHEFQGGRAFYTAGGHTEESYHEPLFQKHLLGGIDYAIGDNHLDYDKAISELVPEENRFVKQVLVNNLNEPMELEVLRDGKVIFIERQGAVKLFEPAKEQARVLAKMNVHTQFEDGLLGLALDPDYYNNHWIYMYYSPAGDEPIQRLSRFVFIADSLLLGTEKKILEVPVQREKCCHTGGSIEFGPDGLLYLSTGDDTSPFNDKELTYNSDGYAPLNELPGWEPYDAQRSSGNTNDLRGKILRIKLNDDASYDIPEGNLFTENDSLAKPEIYVMGCRNPYRISIDQKTGILYYGDVGPDAGEDSERGPAGHDELNQVRQAGNFGWPFFVADNKAYSQFDYSSGEIGKPFNPVAPLNQSVNNTGKTQLPPAQPALIYYPYDESKLFEDLQTGGRNAMAGPVYYSDFYPNSKNKLPPYYDGKLFFYDWMRDWIMAVTFDENHYFEKYEPFLPGMEFANIMDITIAPDGSMYMLEYGSNWFAQNIDATLSRIDFAKGNRAPVAKISADKTIGAAPLTVSFSAERSFDFDAEDSLLFEWYFQDKDEKQGSGATTQFTFDKPGFYYPMVRVQDASGDFATASLEVKVGNEIPEVTIDIEGNHSFYWPKDEVSYAVSVNDLEDGNFPGSGIRGNDIVFSIDYSQVGLDETMSAQGHRQKSDMISGATLVEEYNCFACHKVNQESIGPTYLQVAERYVESTENVEMLANKIIKGGNGNWGEQNMSAHPQISLSEATTIVNYILALNNQDVKPSVPLQGSFYATEGQKGYYILMASYTDKGGEIIGPLRGDHVLRLRYPEIELEEYDSASNVRKRRPAGSSVDMVVSNGDQSHMLFENIDMRGINYLEVVGKANISGFRLEVRQSSLAGKMIGQSDIPTTEENELVSFRVPISDPLTGPRNLYFLISRQNNQESDDEQAYLDKVFFHNGLKPKLSL